MAKLRVPTGCGAESCAAAYAEKSIPIQPRMPTMRASTLERMSRPKARACCTEGTPAMRVRAGAATGAEVAPSDATELVSRFNTKKAWG